MSEAQLRQLIEFRHFPSVVHPRHAREIIAHPTNELLDEWVGGYAITVHEHRNLLEDILGSLAWQHTGQAVLIHGLYGTGKSHFQVLLHLLISLPDSWPCFLEVHPEFRRYALAINKHKRLVAHFSLDEYGPSHELEGVVFREVTRAMEQAHIHSPITRNTDESRLDTWSAIFSACSESGYDGLVLLIDELSLFLAGKSPARREADAGFLQFLADLAVRTPLWLVGSLQRHLADTGPLRTHSWRQVEDRFRRYALSQQAISDVLRDKLITRTNPTAIRELITSHVVPSAVQHKIDIPMSAWQVHWPFHPMALSLMAEIANAYLSPHRSLVDVLQQFEHTELANRQPTVVITACDLFTLFKDDLQRDERLQRVWQAVDRIRKNASACTDPALADELITMLVMQFLAGRQMTVQQFHDLLFTGISSPSLEDISQNLHALRRHGSHITVNRDHRLSAECFTLEVDDNLGTQATMRLQEIADELTIHDPRIHEIVFAACTDAAWPLQGALTGMTMSVPWHGSERTVQVRLSRTTTPEVLARGYEGVAGNQTDGFIFMGFPDAALQSAGQPALDEGLSETPASTVIFWQPRQRNAAEQDLWHEFACWHLAAHTANPADTTPEKQLRRYCQQREDELRAATVASVQAIYAEGSCYDARGQRCHFTPGETLTTTLADILATGFDELFPVFSTMPAHDLPPHHVVEHIISQFIVPGTITLTPQSLLSTYLERYVQPLGCVAVQDHQATVVSPGPEIIRTLLATVSDTPVRITEILAMLHAKPLGLPAAYGRIAIAAATRTGVMQGFDAFVQPVAPDTPAAEIALVGIPEPVADEFRDAIKLLAEFWDIPQVPWQLTCSQVNLRLRNWLTETAHRIPVIHDAVSSWSDVLDILPWGWKSTHDALTAVQRAEELPQPSFGDLLRSLSTPRNLITQVDRLWEATTWWQEHREMVSYIFNHALPEHVSVEAETLQERLSSGEEALENFPNTRHRFDEMISAYHAAYQQWHDTVFGTRVVNALREAFAHPDFRAIKLLVRLPLPIPDTVQHCLKALEQARTAYCPGVFSNFALHGVCEHCHLPFGSASPMPEAHQILEWAMTGLREYVNLLATHEWSINIRKSLQRAPEDITLRVEQLFTWHIEHGSEVIPTILDEQVLTWLCHDRQVKGTRQVAQLHARLAGRDLTIAEAQTQLHEWLNPGHDCDDDTLLAFE